MGGWVWGRKSGGDVQLPGAVTQLGTSLANVKMANLIIRNVSTDVD